MPLYSYDCSDCGPFRSWNPMSQAAAPAPCPTCDRPGARAVAAPFIANMNPHSRIAHQRNEKSAHEPQVMSRAQLERSGRRRGHAHGNGHCAGHHHAPPKKPGPDGSNYKTSGKRWMVGH